jgi:PAS domain S-box-containing protein
MLQLNEPSPPHRAHVRYARVQRRIVVLGVLVLVAFAASSFYDAWRSYRRTILSTDRELGNLAAALAEQTAWTWEAVDLLLSETALWYRNDGVELSSEALDGALTARSAGVRQVRRLRIIDARGIVRQHSQGASPPSLDVSDRSYFTAQRDGRAAGLFLSEPLVSRTDGRTAVILSRRLEDGAGKFAGVVTATVDLQDLKQFYQNVNLGAGSAIQLLRADGSLLVRNPPTLQLVGERFPQLATAANASVSRRVSPIDGQPDFIAIARVRDTPLVLAVTREEAVVLRQWRDESVRFAVRTLGLTLLGALAIAALVRQLGRIEGGQRALRESEERYALAMEGANEGHWDWNLEDDRLFLSPKMQLLYGLPENLPVRTRSEWRERVQIHPDDLAAFETSVADHLAGRTPQYEIDYRVRYPDAEWHWLHVRGRCMRNPAGTARRFVGSAMDVTSQKRAQADNERLEAQLRQSQKMEAIGTLAGGIAHDFNNILGAIIGYGELAQQHAAAGSSLRRYLDNVMHAAERARALVDRILGFSRSGMAERVPVHIQAVVEETLELLRASLPTALRLEKELAAGNAAVIGDATRLHQVVMNLCTNAVQAMTGEGVLHVSLDRIELPAARMLRRGKLPQGSYVRLTITDTGKGIPSEVVDRIFDPFFTTKAVGEGTGLGLSLVHGIVADLGGAIELETRVGEGTTFRIWLAVSGEVAEPLNQAAIEPPRGNGETVMIVDDEPALVSLIEEMLAQLGYEPIGFGSSGAALHAVRANPTRFDAVLTDETMPDLVGTDLAREVGAIRPGIPILLMSGHGGAGLAQRAGAAGVSEVLRKPLQKRDLAESLARLLGSG